jgi:hypothetical protein
VSNPLPTKKKNKGSLQIRRNVPPAEAGCASDFISDLDAIHISRGYKKVYYSRNEDFWESRTATK